jgi:hypothetical protein
MANIGSSDDGTDREERVSFEKRWDMLVLERRFIEAAELLRSEIARQSNPVARGVLMGDLAVVLDLNGQPAEALAVMHERIALAPDEPIGWCALANYHFRDATARDDETDKKMALETIDHAVAAADRTNGAWLRHCLNDRARIAKAFGRWHVVEDSVRRILAIPNGRGVPDTAVEIDFLTDIPTGILDQELIDRLRERHAADAERRRLRRLRQGEDEPGEASQ